MANSKLATRIPKLTDKGTTQMARTGDILGYARVSTSEQSTSAQTERLKEAGAIRVFEDVISGKQFERP